ncbi:hypothetical protein SAMN04487895_12539 [Paenibacillus sophorae]|uniref:Uncharacterized protein n=1 Tax=Paenibacillus sophorae TaxID=1333845 RepID=A0A1H8VL18_9BACL|nr:hypothetical protein [Paenibacillus sophorae]QWU17190.1 hypothetical protein KP014_08505 [Paenibacillus sophorae]SEP16086.1 hypothetical protein SAMN04487895_12539 [Paenibacillus sophorae]
MDNGWQENEGGPEIPATAVDWEELTASRREEEIIPGTDNLDPDQLTREE